MENPQNDEEETSFCATLGRMVMTWNSVEHLVRLLLYKAAGGHGDRTEVLIANLGNVGLCEALSAIADDHDEPFREHLKHCGKLFDAERIYRNHYVHDPVIFGREGMEEEVLIALTQHTTANGGALRLHQGRLTEPQITAFLGRIKALNQYGTGIIACLYRIPDSAPLSSLEKPPLPDKLEFHRLNLIEHKRQLREQQA